MNPLLSVLLFVFSQASAAPVFAGFCQSPQAFVCGGQTAQRREQSIEVVVNRLTANALKRTSQITREKFNDEDELDNAKFPKQAKRIFLNELRQSVRAYLAGNGVSPDYDFPKLKMMLKDALLSAPEIHPSAKAAFLKIIDEIRFVSVTATDGEFASSKADSDLLDDCDNNGLDDNAFSQQNDDNSRVIVVCPGYVIGSIEYAKRAGLPKNLWLTPMLMTVVHEIAHQFDARDFPATYGFVQQFLATHRQGLRGNVPVSAYMSEVSADWWGSRVLRNYLLNLTDQRLRDLVLRGNLEDLCGSEDDGQDADGGHPSGAYRLNVTIRAELCQ